MLNTDDNYITTKTRKPSFRYGIVLFFAELVDYIGEFLEVAFNMILFTREVYPASKSFYQSGYIDKSSL